MAIGLHTFTTGKKSVLFGGKQKHYLYIGGYQVCGIMHNRKLWHLEPYSNQEHFGQTIFHSEWDWATLHSFHHQEFPNEASAYGTGTESRKFVDPALCLLIQMAIQKRHAWRNRLSSFLALGLGTHLNSTLPFPVVTLLTSKMGQIKVLGLEQSSELLLLGASGGLVRWLGRGLMEWQRTGGRGDNCESLPNITNLPPKVLPLLCQCSPMHFRLLLCSQNSMECCCG